MSGILSLSKFLSKRGKADLCGHDVIVIDRAKRIVICERCLEELDPLEMLARCGGFSDQGEIAIQPGSDNDKGEPTPYATVHRLRPKS